MPVRSNSNRDIHVRRISLIPKTHKTSNCLMLSDQNSKQIIQDGVDPAHFTNIARQLEAYGQMILEAYLQKRSQQMEQRRQYE